MIPYDIPLSVVLCWLFVFGAVVGSFLNVCIWRIPRHDRLWDQLAGLNHPPSSCPYCKRQIWAIDNIPILGWLWLRGRCLECRAPISPRYPIVEALVGTMSALLGWAAIEPAMAAETQARRGNQKRRSGVDRSA